jgi:3',5'-cyclic AMP phosphodiesterase CpdA
MFKLAQLSDLHLSMPPRPIELIGKRGLGYINWHRGRRYIHWPEVLEQVTADLKAQPTDHIAVTGDLVNLSLPSEYARARSWLDRLGAPTDVTVIPGNHDIYVPSALNGPAQFWGEYMRGDDGGGFPFVRHRGPVALIALSSAVPTGPFMATGRLGEAQRERLAAALDQNRDRFRVVLIHHPPVTPPARHLRRLLDGAEFCQVIASKGAELVLHGHDHRRAVIWLDGPGGRRVPVIGVPSASAQKRHGHENGAGYNIYLIDGASGAWRCDMIGRERSADGVITEVERRTII